MVSCVCGFSNATYQKMLAVLAQCETTMTKSVEVYNMNLREQETYDSLNERIGQCHIFSCNMFLGLVSTIDVINVFFRLRPIPVLGIGIGPIPVVSVRYRYRRYLSRYHTDTGRPLFVD